MYPSSGSCKAVMCFSDRGLVVGSFSPSGRGWWYAVMGLSGRVLVVGYYVNFR
jgi:hypothetical protein